MDPAIEKTYKDIMKELFDKFPDFDNRKLIINAEIENLENTIKVIKGVQNIDNTEWGTKIEDLRKGVAAAAEEKARVGRAHV